MKISKPAIATTPNIRGSYFSNPAEQLAILRSWNPIYFTNPVHCIKMQNRGYQNLPFKFIIHTAPLSYLIEQKGIFSKNAQQTIQQWDVISASIISDTKPFSYFSVGVILRVPAQNILVAHHSDLMSDLNVGLPNRTDYRVCAPHNNRAYIDCITMPAYQQTGLLSKKIFCFDHQMDTPDEILGKTYHHHNEMIIALKPGINIHPTFPATQNVQITGLFLMDCEPSEEARHLATFKGQYVYSKEEKYNIFIHSAYPLAQELKIPALLINGQADIND